MNDPVPSAIVTIAALASANVSAPHTIAAVPTAMSANYPTIITAPVYYTSTGSTPCEIAE